MINLYVSCLPEGCNSKELRSHFSAFGNCGKINVRKKAGSLFGFVQIDNDEDLDKMNESMLRGCHLKVERAKADEKEVKPQPEVIEHEEGRGEQEEEQQQEEGRVTATVSQNDYEEQPKKKKKKAEKKRKESENGALDDGAETKPSKKVRETFVPAVAKSTVWDEVIGHKWEDKNKEPSSFSVLSFAKAKEDEDESQNSNFTLAATKYFLKDADSEAAKKQNALTKAFEEKLKKLENQRVEEKEKEDNDGMTLNVTSDFMMNEKEMDQFLSNFKDQRSALRKDFKKKRYKAKRKN